MAVKPVAFVGWQTLQEGRVFHLLPYRTIRKGFTSAMATVYLVDRTRHAEPYWDANITAQWPIRNLGLRCATAQEAMLAVETHFRGGTRV